MSEKNRPQDDKWILRTLRLAKRGIPWVSPNPYVGCVIAKGARVLSQGAHLKFGGPHAEISALRAAGRKAKGATLYVNLEPCSHWGKTGPCVDAIIGAGIKRVVAAMGDPNPLVRGKGFKALIRAGIKVDNGIRKDEARDLNRSFVKFITRQKPYVFLKSALSLDGKIATSAGESKWITSPESRAFAHRIRSQMDAVLVGAETVRRDDPSLTSHGSGRDPLRVILTRTGRIKKTSKIFSKGPAPLVLKGNVSQVLKKLAEGGVSRLLVEGGGETAAEFLESGNVDEAFFFIAPILIGGRDAKTGFEGRGFRAVKDALKLKDVTTRKIGPDILIHGRL